MLITPEISSAVNFARLNRSVSPSLVLKSSPVSRCGMKRARRGLMHNSCSLCVCLFVLIQSFLSRDLSHYFATFIFSDLYILL